MFSFWPFRNFYSVDAQHPNDGKHSLNHHFQHCAHSVYQSFSFLKLFEIAVCFATFAFYEISSPVIRTMLTMVNIVQIMISNSAHTVHMRFTGFWNFSKMVFGCTFWLLRNFYPGHAHHANYGGHSLNHQFQHCAHSVYQIYSVFKLFEIAVCFAPFALYPISSPVIRTMLTMVNIV